MEDKYEEEREQLRKQAEAHERKTEQKREKMLQNVMSFSESFDKSFFKYSKKIKYNNISFYSLLEDDESLDKIPTTSELKNNFNESRLKDEIVEVIKNENRQDYLAIKKNINTTTITKQYQSVFVFEFSCVCTIVTTLARFVRHNYYDGCVSSKTNIVDVCGKGIVDIPKGKLNLKNICSSNFNDFVEINMAIKPTKQKVSKLYLKLKKQAISCIEKKIKTMCTGTNYCLRAVDFDMVSIKRILIPFYVVHCKKPGFDVKYIINANSKKCI